MKKNNRNVLLELRKINKELKECKELNKTFIKMNIELIDKLSKIRSKK